MLALAVSSPQKPKIQFFERINGIKKIFEKMLEIPQTEIVNFSNFQTLSNISDEFLANHFKKRDDLKIKTRFISPLVR